ncbi:VanZ family protein [Actinomycetes bacterium KLBMP 9797]
MRGWANDFLSQPWPALTLVALAAVALVAHRRIATRLGWSRWPTLGALVGLAIVLTLTLPPAPGAAIGSPEWSAAGRCVESLFDPAVLWRGLISTASRGERVGNVLMFVPLTFFTVLATRRLAWTVVVGVVLPIGIELTQSITAFGRECVGYDWVNNAIGALLGAVLGALTVRGLVLFGAPGDKGTAN